MTDTQRRRQIPAVSDSAAEQRRVRRLEWIAGASLAIVISSFLSVMGVPVWNLYFILFAWFIAAPVGVVATGLLVRALLVRAKRRRVAI